MFAPKTARKGLLAISATAQHSIWPPKVSQWKKGWNGNNYHTGNMNHLVIGTPLNRGYPTGSWVCFSLTSHTFAQETEDRHRVYQRGIKALGVFFATNSMTILGVGAKRRLYFNLRLQPQPRFSKFTKFRIFPTHSLNLDILISRWLDGC